jgi:diguanylate cyclase (GGDEF)-like protein
VSEPPGTGSAILVVDDDDQVRGLLVRLLEGAGYACVQARDAAEAMRRLHEQCHVALMLCDVSMPGESGLDLVRRVLRERPDVAAVMVTALDDSALASAALELGAYGYVIKPFRTSELLISVANALRRRTLEGENRDHRERLEELLQIRTAALRRRASQQHRVAELGQRALYGLEPHALFEEALGIAREELEVELAALVQLGPDRTSLQAVASAGWPRPLGELQLPAGRESDTGLAIASESPVVVADFRLDGRFTGPLGLADGAASSGLTVVVRVGQGPFGALSVHAMQPQAFSAEDVSFLQGLANVVGSALSRLAMEEEIRHQALHDPLTGLPNRSLLVDRLEQGLRRTSRQDGCVALLFIDLDQFKTINDSLGHQAGDRLLVAVTARLSAFVRPTDTLARFGGDEFVLVCEVIDRAEAAVEIARRIGQALRAPFALDGDRVFVTASIGIALSDRRSSAEDLLRDADAAMYRAKETGRSRYELFDAHLRRQVVERMRLQTALQWAVERNELRVHYQPLVALGDGRILGFEALARWQHPERGLLSAGAFIPIAEDSGLIALIGASVLRDACAQLARWRCGAVAGDRPTVSVNVAARQLADPGFAALVGELLAEHGLEPGALRLEITETMLVEESAASQATIGALAAMGVPLVLDDFGTGYSALGSIKRFPLAALKLDRSFAQGLVDDAAQQSLVGGIVSIGHALGLDIVAEGIETEHQAAVARALGCDVAQGYLFARPADAAAATDLLVVRNGRAAHG